MALGQSSYQEDDDLTTFKAPLGNEPVAVDLLGMGKGNAWVNGRSIGCFWPSYLADKDGCNTTCDYLRPYGDKKCITNCGGSSQRWYHIPRSFLRDDMNTSVLFEEFGGNPSLVNFLTTVDSACANAYEGHTLELSYHGNGRTISAIEFASFGDPQGSCGSFAKGTCESDTTLSVLEQQCVGQESCSVNVSEASLGSTNCDNITKKLAIQVKCQ